MYALSVSVTWISSSPILFLGEIVSGGEHKEDVVVVTTVEGGQVDLPCDIRSPTPGDSVYLVLWYRKDSGSASSKESGTPIYR